MESRTGFIEGRRVETYIRYKVRIASVNVEVGGKKEEKKSSIGQDVKNIQEIMTSPGGCRVYFYKIKYLFLKSSKKFLYNETCYRLYKCSIKNRREVPHIVFNKHNNSYMLFLS